MTSRQKKIIFSVVGVYVAGMIIYLVVTGVFISKVQDRKAAQTQLITDINKISDEMRLEGTYQARYRQKVAQMLPGTESEVSSYLAATIMTLADSSHVDAKTQALDLKTKTAGFREIGRAVTAKGKLQNLVDLLYLLQAQPFLHRLDGLTLGRTDPKNNEFKMDFHYAVMIVDPAKNKRAGFTKPSTQPATLPVPVQDLDTPQRRQYDAIAARDLFRPYLKRYVEPPPAPSPTPQPTETPTPRPTPPPRRQEFQVCSLTSWGGKQEVGIRSGSEVRYYKPGDKLEGGQVVMIDYRRVPKPDNPKLDSPSRLILKIGNDYWAVELEKNLSDKRLLKPEQLPPELRDEPSTAPADQGPREASADGKK